MLTFSTERDRTTASALLKLLSYLASQNYNFVTPTPATHAIILGRDPLKYGISLTDVLGWNFAFIPGTIDPLVEATLLTANMAETTNDALRSLVRVSTLDGQMFLHSGYPTADKDAVFFGPDSYRFADLIQRELGPLKLPEGASIVDIGTGSGIGAIVAARLQPLARVAMTDINANALRLAVISAQAAEQNIEAYCGGELAGIAGPIHIAIANPPYIIDPDERIYRDGGGALGGAVSLQMARVAINRLAPHGRLIIYTGSAISGGRDALHDDMIALAQSVGARLHYREIDPDVFGEELRNAAYANVDRIAVIAAIVEMP